MNNRYDSSSSYEEASYEDVANPFEARSNSVGSSLTQSSAPTIDSSAIPPVALYIPKLGDARGKGREATRYLQKLPVAKEVAVAAREFFEEADKAAEAKEAYQLNRALAVSGFAAQVEHHRLTLQAQVVTARDTIAAALATAARRREEEDRLRKLSRLDYENALKDRRLRGKKLDAALSRADELEQLSLDIVAAEKESSAAKHTAVKDEHTANSEAARTRAAVSRRKRQEAEEPQENSDEFSPVMQHNLKLSRTIARDRHATQRKIDELLRGRSEADLSPSERADLVELRDVLSRSEADHRKSASVNFLRPTGS